MPNVRIAFCDGKFISHNGVEVKQFSEKSTEANGWKCEINSSGKFSCTAVYFANGMKNQVKMILDNGGLVKTKWRKERERPKYKWFKLRTTPVEGIIILPSITSDMQAPKFNECSVEAFVKEYGMP